jgi:hypothetical protein
VLKASLVSEIEGNRDERHTIGRRGQHRALAIYVNESPNGTRT